MSDWRDKPIVVFQITIPVGEGHKVVRVERQQTRQATGLWNRLRRRRWVTDVELVGVYLADVHRFEMTRSTNAPGTLSLSLSGSDALGDLLRRRLTDVDD